MKGHGCEIVEKKMNSKHRKTVRPDIHYIINELKQEKIFLKEINKYLSKKEVEVEEIMEMLSHELRTPMVPITVHTDMLLGGHFGKLNEKQRKRLKVVSSSIKYMHRFISNLIDVEKFEIGEVFLDKKQHDLNEIILDTISSMKDEKNELDEKLHYFQKTKTSDTLFPIPVFCDSRRISQVLINLIENSLDAIPKDKGQIEINVEDGEVNTIRVTVKDNGTGIPQDKLSHIFSKFYQVDMSRTKEKGGAGLGLCLCKKIIESHDGKIWATSTVGRGTVVTFTLPKD